MRIERGEFVGEAFMIRGSGGVEDEKMGCWGGRGGAGKSGVQG